MEDNSGSPLLDVLRVVGENVAPFLGDRDFELLRRTSRECSVFADRFDKRRFRDRLVLRDFVSSVAMLRWARENGCPAVKTACQYAAQNGDLDVLKWARANGFPWNKLVCEFAAQGGHLDVLGWAHDNGCPWDAWTCASAALGGHFDILKWAWVRGCPMDKFTCVFATMRGREDIVLWARENGCVCLELRG